MPSALQRRVVVRPRTPVFLLNVNTQCVYGVFNPASEVGRELVPGAFAADAAGADATGADAAGADAAQAPSPFPVQLKVRGAPGAADCPALLQNFVHEALLAAQRSTSADAAGTGFAALARELPPPLMQAMEARREALGIAGISTGPLSIDEAQGLVDSLVRARNIAAPMLPKPPVDTASGDFSIDMPLGLAAAAVGAAAEGGGADDDSTPAASTGGAVGMDSFAVLTELARVADALCPRSLRDVMRSSAARLRLSGARAREAFRLLGGASELAWLSAVDEVSEQPLQLTLSVRRPRAPQPPVLAPPPPEAPQEEQMKHVAAMQQKQFAFHLASAQYECVLMRCVEDFHEVKRALTDIMAVVHRTFPPLLRGLRSIMRKRAEAVQRKMQAQPARQGGEREKRHSRGRSSKSREERVSGAGRKRSRDDEKEPRSGEKSKRSRDGAYARRVPPSPPISRPPARPPAARRSSDARPVAHPPPHRLTACSSSLSLSCARSLARPTARTESRGRERSGHRRERSRERSSHSRDKRSRDERRSGDRRSGDRRSGDRRSSDRRSSDRRSDERRDDRRGRGSRR